MKNVHLGLFLSKDMAKYAMFHSNDDKAYMHPGTSEGYEKTRNVKVIRIADKARHLSKYDWSENKVYQTPAAHRV